MMYHPTIYILVTAILMGYFKDRRNSYLNFISIIGPICALVSLFYLNGSYRIDLAFTTIIYTTDAASNLVAYALIIALLIANLFAASNKDYNELILGNIYASLGLAAVFAGDFVSLFIALELMMIVSAVIIFIGGYRRSFSNAKKYFLTHLMTGNMLIIGISYLFIQFGNFEIRNVGELITDTSLNNFPLYLILAACLINIAAFPFSGWMVNYYKEAKPAGFNYLICFTTKISVLMLYKLFAGFEVLQYFAILLIIYSSIKAMLQSNLFSLLCLFSIMQMGFIIIAIAQPNIAIQQIAIIYLSLHIIYKISLSLGVSTLSTEHNIFEIGHLKKIDSKLFNFCIILAIAIMIGTPGFSSYILKTQIKHHITELYTNAAITALTIFSIIALPINSFFISNQRVEFKFNKTLIAAYILAILAMFGQIFVLPLCLDFLGFQVKFENQSSLAEPFKQSCIIVAGLIFAYLTPRINYDLKTINLLEELGNLLFYGYYLLKRRSLKQTEKEDYYHNENIAIIIRRLYPTFFNQQTAIMLVFINLIILLATYYSKLL